MQSSAKSMELWYTVPKNEKGELAMTPEQASFVKTLFEQHYQLLFLHARTVLDNPSLAEDVVQDSFLALINRVDEVMAHPRPDLWLLVTLHNKLLKCTALRARDCAVFLSYSLPDTPEPGEEDRALSQVDEDWAGALDLVQQALSQDEFRFLIRQVLDGASHKELAQEFHLSVEGTKKKRHRIKRKLHKKLPDLWRRLKENDES